MTQRFPVTSSPLAGEDHLLVARADGHLLRVGIQGGDVDTVAELGSGPSTDPTRAGKLFFLGRQGERVLLLDPENGQAVAENELNVQATCRWLLHEDPDADPLLIGSTGIDGPNRRVVALDAQTLQLRWERQPTVEGRAWTTAQPASCAPRVVRAIGEELWIGSFDGQVVAMHRARRCAERAFPQHKEDERTPCGIRPFTSTE